jgi:MSHA biogenesis protein MshO
VADNVLGCSFSVMQLPNRNTALIGLSIALARARAGDNNLEAVTLVQQIQVNNTP